jgi:hypothetical protein
MISTIVAPLTVLLKKFTGAGTQIFHLKPQETTIMSVKLTATLGIISLRPTHPTHTANPAKNVARTAKAVYSTETTVQSAG